MIHLIKDDDEIEDEKERMILYNQGRFREPNLIPPDGPKKSLQELCRECGLVLRDGKVG